MADAVEEIISEVLAIAGTLGLPVEIDYPFEPKENELPLVLIDTGDEEVVEEDGMPVEGWATYWRVNPEIKIMIQRDDPMEVHADLTAKWSTLRQAIYESRIPQLVRYGTKPALRKMPIIDEGKPGIAGLHIQFDMEVERE